MSDENTAPQPEAPAPEKAPPASIAVISEVVDKIKGSAPDVRSRLVAKLVEDEVSNRVSLLDKGLQKRLEAEKEVKKCSKPDVETFDADGKSVAAGFTKGAAENLKKAREQYDKIEKALEKALGDNDFSKLRDICSK